MTDAELTAEIDALETRLRELKAARKTIRNRAHMQRLNSDPAFAAKRLAAQRKVKASPEHRAAMSDLKRRQWADPRIRETFEAAMNSPAAKANRSAGQRQRWAREHAERDLPDEPKRKRNSVRERPIPRDPLETAVFGVGS